MTHLAFELMTGVGTAQIAELGESAAFLKQLPAYAAHFRRAGISPEQTSIAAASPAAAAIAGF
ncbi:MAG TPA: hypothetical protein VFQ68_13750 [Streptosporangiaceae bacterium]|nr:hypothetical protein [Streptosporangiaceae bacterium]